MLVDGLPSVTEMSGGNFCVVGFNIPGRIGREWMYKHHLGEDKEFIVHEQKYMERSCDEYS